MTVGKNKAKYIVQADIQRLTEPFHRQITIL